MSCSVRPGSLFGLAANLGLGGCNFQDFFRKTGEDFDLFGFRYFRISDFDGVARRGSSRCRGAGFWLEHVGTSVEAGVAQATQGMPGMPGHKGSKMIQNDSK